jgi:hypothetical protein
MMMEDPVEFVDDAKAAIAGKLELGADDFLEIFFGLGRQIVVDDGLITMHPLIQTGDFESRKWLDKIDVGGFVDFHNASYSLAYFFGLGRIWCFES